MQNTMIDLPVVANRFAPTLEQHQLSLQHDRTQVLQINVGKRCNQTCAHCHVNAGPGRSEVMTRETVNRIVEWLAQTDIPTVDITGGAPELNPNFRYLVESIKALAPTRHIIDRCNLTVLFEPQQDGLADFLAAHTVEIIASLPCYSAENVDAQRGNGVFDKSIAGLQKLNALGYGADEDLPLNLVYNPVGPHLPSPQEQLEADYRRELKEHFGIVFNHLYTITNLPIARFAAYLRRSGQLEDYQRLLVNSFNPASVAGLMCRNTLNIGWRGEVYDCDFNQMLDMQWRNGKPLFLWDIKPEQVVGRPILTGNHCFGCTAGAGSSCGGAIVRLARRCP